MRHKMKQFLFLFLSIVGFYSMGAIRIDPPQYWQCAPAGAEAVTMAEGTDWQAAKLYRNGNIRYERMFKIPGLKAVTYYADWEIPVDCAGRNLTLSVGKSTGDLTVFVNGKKSGVIPFPAGEADLTGAIIPGRKNRIEIHVSKYQRHYVNPREQEITFGDVALLITDGLRISDVFAETSYRKKLIAFETEIVAVQNEQAAVTYKIFDETGKKVKDFTVKTDLKPGTNLLKSEFPWSDFITWEIGRPYLYNCEVSVVSGKIKDMYPRFSFGFRELWREGKEIYMNGHLQRFRTVYSYAAHKKGAEFLRSIGYNQLVLCHVRQTFPQVWDEQTLNVFDRMGISVSVPTPGLRFIGDKIRDENSPVFKEYLRCMKFAMRKLRNHPSVCTAYVSLLANGAHSQQYPELIGQREDRSSGAANINKAAAIGRGFNPPILYSGFGDGNTGDISSLFAYLNFTPLQEREEWLSQWSEKGIYPIVVHEFGQPYTGSFWKGKAFLPTEYLAMYFGDQVYLAETAEGLDSLVEAGITPRSAHGGPYNPKLYPFWNDFHRMFTRSTNYAWRAYGINGGMIYFNLRYGFGDPPGVKGKNSNYSRYAHVPSSYSGGKPDWANEDYDIYRQGNEDLCVFLGGAPEHTAKDHSFSPGDKVSKNLVFVWDGFGEKNVEAEWKVLLDGKLIVSGKVDSFSLNTGDIVKKPFSFIIPEVKSVENGKITVIFKTATGEEVQDSFTFEVYPEKKYDIPVRDVLLFDPIGATAGMLDKLGVKYRKIARLDESVRKAEYLILGRFSLSKANFSFNEKDIEAGLNVLIMAQQTDELKALGFRVEDRMARIIFLRDKFNPNFSNIGPNTLKLWSGAPDYGKPFGNLTEGETQRFTHWKRTHTVAGNMIQIPEHGGFIPLMDGEFDMNFSPLLSWLYGKGHIMFCTLDSENRPGTDPAPLLTMECVLKEFFSRNSQPNSKSVAANGKNAVKLLQKTGFSIHKDGDIIVADSSAKLSWNEICQDAANGKSFLIYANKQLTLEAGLKTEHTIIRHLGQPLENTPLLRGVGPSLFRWRSPVEIDRIVDAPKDFKVIANGIMAESEALKGKIVFVQADPFQLDEKFISDDNRRQATFLSTERMIQLGARLLTNLGAKPGETTARRLLYQTANKDFAPLKAFFILGPFNIGKDDGKIMLDTVFSGESSAIRGDNAPEEEYPLPQGGTANWRTTASSDDKGRLDFRQLGGEFSKHSFAVNYGLHFFERNTDTDAILRFNVDWRAKIWSNGELVFQTLRGTPGKLFEVKLTNLKKGRNYLVFKIGSGAFGCTMDAFMTPESRENTIIRKEISGLREHSFYERTYPNWDPYQHFYW